MRRTLLSTGIGLTLTGLLAVPALGAPASTDDAPRSAWAAIDAGSLSPHAHRRLVRVAPTDQRPADVRPDVRPDAPERDLEELRMACHGRTNDEGRSAIGCEWSATELDRAAGYRLERADGDIRETVFRTDDLTQTTFVDGEIRPGHRYVYRVLVVNAEGRTIGSGGPVKAGVEIDREIEVLHLGCEARPDAAIVGCRWEPATSKEAAGYRLWRSVDRDGRTLVYRGGLDQTSFVDETLGDAQVVHYAVLAIDADGEILGRSRAFAIRFDEPGPRPTIDVRPIDRPVDPIAPEPVRPAGASA